MIGLLDYGLVGRLEPDKRDQLVDLLAAVARGDVRSVVVVLRDIGRPFRPIDEARLSADVRDFLNRSTVCHWSGSLWGNCWGTSSPS